MTRHTLLAYARMTAIVAACTIVSLRLTRVMDPANIVMLFLLAVAIVAVTSSRGPAIAASILSVAAFDWFFVPPYHTFAVADYQYLVTFAVMLGVALALSGLAARLRTEVRVARDREATTAALYRLSRELASRSDITSLTQATAHVAAELLDARTALFLATPDDTLRLAVGDAAVFDGQADGEARRICFDQRIATGRGTPTVPTARALYVPLLTARRVVGVLALDAPRADVSFARAPFPFVQAYANQAAVALERALTEKENEQARLAVEAERTRANLLSAVSHDLRTPLAAITGAATSLIDSEVPLDEETRADLLATIAGETVRLDRFVSNLLAITRLEAAPTVAKDWHSVEDVVGAVLGRFGAALDGRPVSVHVDPGMPLVPLDDVLFAQALTHLVENVLAHTPPETPLEIAARREGDAAIVEVLDRGAGLRPGDEERVFEKFYRGPGAGANGGPQGAPGVGLGLAICRAIVEAHGGRIVAGNRDGGGAVFRITLPLDREPPRVEREGEMLPASGEESEP